MAHGPLTPLFSPYRYQAQKLSDAFARLRDAYWIDEQTRAVIIKLTFYNGACGGCPKLTVTSDPR